MPRSQSCASPLALTECSGRSLNPARWQATMTSWSSRAWTGGESAFRPVSDQLTRPSPRRPGWLALADGSLLLFRMRGGTRGLVRSPLRAPRRAAGVYAFRNLSKRLKAAGFSEPREYFATSMDVSSAFVPARRRSCLDLATRQWADRGLFFRLARSMKPECLFPTRLVLARRWGGRSNNCWRSWDWGVPLRSGIE